MSDVYCLDPEEARLARIEERLRDLDERLAFLELSQGECESDPAEVAARLAPAVTELLAEAS